MSVRDEARLLRAETPLGDRAWVLRFKGKERLSRPYKYQLDLLSEEAGLDLQPLLGEPVAVTLQTQAGPRVFSGRVARTAACGQYGRHWRTRLTLVPRLWFASKRSDFRIWQSKTVPGIVRDILEQNGIRYDWRLKTEYKTWEYIVQYGETDLDFISRLLEREGIYYGFAHSADGETLLLFDHFTVHETVPGYETIPWHPPCAHPRKEHFSGAQSLRTPKTGRQRHRAYDFRHPGQDLERVQADPCGHLFDQTEIYQYPGDYLAPQDGQDATRQRLEGRQRRFETVTLTGDVRGVHPGAQFTLIEHPITGLNRSYLTVRTRFEITNNDYENSPDSAVADCRVDIKAMPTERQYRPPQRTPKPQVFGAETATVVGLADQEVHTDQYGRVKVHFHWDRYGQRDGADSCWIRVLSASSGPYFGAQSIPRISQEVIVTYEYGDPERPLILGTVPNGEHLPVRFSGVGNLPANKMLTGIKTKEHLHENTNELLFDDTPGEIRTKLSSDHGQSQLNLGYLVHPRAGSAEPRGEGAELRTDLTLALRAARGLLLTAHAREGARGNSLDRPELIHQLERALEIAQALSARSEAQQADDTDTKEQETLLNTLQQWEQGTNTDPKSAPNAHAPIAVSAPDGIALASHAAISTVAAQHDTVAVKDSNTSVGRYLRLRVGEAFSLFVHKLGMKLIAASGKVQMEAQSDELSLYAAKTLTLRSATEIVFVAPKITLRSNGASVEVGEGHITSRTMGTHLRYADVHKHLGPADLARLPQTRPQGELKLPMIFQMRLHGMPYKLYADDTIIKEDVFDKSGYVLAEYDTSIERYQIELVNGDRYVMPVVQNPVEEQDTTVEVIVGDSMRNPSSWFGHMAIAIDGTVYTRAHEKYAMMSHDKYINIHQRPNRNSSGYFLRVTQEEKQKMETELKRRVAENKKYGFFDNSCSTNVADVLEAVGIMAHDPRGFGTVSPSDFTVGLPRSKRFVKKVLYPRF